MKRTTRTAVAATAAASRIGRDFSAALGWSVAALGAFALLHNLAQLL